MSRPYRTNGYVAQVRAARRKALLAVGAAARYCHPAGPVPGTITKLTDASAWFTYKDAAGQENTLRFTQRQDGEYRLVGKASQHILQVVGE